MRQHNWKVNLVSGGRVSTVPFRAPSHAPSWHTSCLMSSPSHSSACPICVHPRLHYYPLPHPPSPSCLSHPMPHPLPHTLSPPCRDGAGQGRLPRGLFTVPGQPRDGSSRTSGCVTKQTHLKLQKGRLSAVDRRSKQRSLCFVN